MVIETGSFDFHEICVTVMKAFHSLQKTFQKLFIVLIPLKAFQKSDLNTNILREDLAFLQNICAVISVPQLILQSFT